jgi:1-aminocyclopropane-1-carboxylate deaminase/D-cysteine desulfhydrase-like pyridoxal-dependent ACC family enzyme
VAVNPAPAFSLAALPTPLRRTDRLERARGAGPIYVKRDDLTGFGVAGNKARKLEHLVADALQRGCDVLVTGGGPGSNHCHAAAAAARVAGLRCVLVVYGQPPAAPPTNLALARWWGASVSFTGEVDRSSVDRGVLEARARLEAEGAVPYVVPRGGATPVGSIGYARAAEELAAQLAHHQVSRATVVVATGSGGTQAGLVAGNVALGRPWRVVGASVSRDPEECRGRVLALAQGCAEAMGSPPPEDGDVEVVDARGPGYGIPSAAGEQAATVAAATEGLLLDPVFTAKAFAALLELVEDVDGAAVFVHTGGLPAALGRRTGRSRDELVAR